MQLNERIMRGKRLELVGSCPEVVASFLGNLLSDHVVEPLKGV